MDFPCDQSKQLNIYDSKTDVLSETWPAQAINSHDNITTKYISGT